MKQPNILVLISLLRDVYSLNSTNVDQTSMNLSRFSASQNVCNTTATNIPTLLIGTSNNRCVLNLSDAEEQVADIESLNQIQYYKNLEKNLWRIFPPVLLGKK